VYDWRPLTSGSRGFAFWPLLLPFTIGNLVGFMAPSGATRRAGLHRLAAVLAGLVLTISTVVWLFVAAVAVWTDVLRGTTLPSWAPGDSSAWAFWLAAASVAIATCGLVLTSTYVADGFERFRPSSWIDPPTRWRWRQPWGPSLGRTLSDERFYDNGPDHRVHWRVHSALAALVWAALVVAVVAGDGPTRPGPVLDWAIEISAVATTLPVLLLVAVAVGGRRRRGWRFVAPAGGVLGATLPGTAILAVLIAFVGIDAVPRGPVAMLFDVAGWSLLAMLAAAVAVAVHALLTASAAERHERSRVYVPTLTARFRSRLAVAPGRLGIAVVAYAGAFTVGTAIVVANRWRYSDQRADWTLTASPPVDVARLTLVFLIGFLLLNSVRQLGNPRALRRVGNVWDIVTFWPRTFHPFAVRPYAERAVPEVREFLTANGTATGPGRGEVVVLAHSQGSVIAYAALLPVLERLAAGASAHVRLVTVGSPLRTLYVGAFPEHVRDDLTTLVAGASAGDGPRLDWTNVYRFTDHVGRSVFASDDVVAAGDGDRRDQPIPDPEPGRAVLGHNDYWSDPLVVAVVRGACEATRQEVGDAP
jgi:hypothetical protein